MKHDFLSFYIVVSKCEEWKEEAFWRSALGDSKHRYATAIEHAVGYYLAGSKSKPNLYQKVHYSKGPKYFFLCVNNRIPSNIFKTFFGQNQQVRMDETISHNFAFW